MKERYVVGPCTEGSLNMTGLHPLYKHKAIFGLTFLEEKRMFVVAVEKAVRLLLFSLFCDFQNYKTETWNMKLLVKKLFT